MATSRQRHYSLHITLSALSMCVNHQQHASYSFYLDIYLDSDVFMKSHVAKTVSACFERLRQLRVNCPRSLPRSVLQTLMSSLILSWLDYGNATLTGIPSYLLQQLHSALRATRVLFIEAWPHHPLLQQLHWLRAPERIQFKLAVLVYLLSAWDSTVVSRRWAAVRGQFRRLEAPPLRFLTVAGCPSYTAVHRSCCCCPYLEQSVLSAPTCHVRTLYNCFPKSPQGFPLQAY